MPEEQEHVPPGVPPRTAYLLAFLAIAVSGLFGATIGYGLVDISCEGSCGLASLIGALIGGIAAAAGVGVIAVLVLRAMSKWKRNQPG